MGNLILLALVGAGYWVLSKRGNKRVGKTGNQVTTPQEGIGRFKDKQQTVLTSIDLFNRGNY